MLLQLAWIAYCIIIIIIIIIQACDFINLTVGCIENSRICDWENKLQDKN
jgi:hypothetical protein